MGQVSPASIVSAVVRSCRARPTALSFSGPRLISRTGTRDAMGCEQRAQDVVYDEHLAMFLKGCSSPGTRSTSEGTSSDSDEEPVTLGDCATHFVASLLEDAVEAFTDDMFDDMPAVVDLLGSPVSEMDDEDCLSDLESVVDIDESPEEGEKEDEWGGTMLLHCAPAHLHPTGTVPQHICTQPHRPCSTMLQRVSRAPFDPNSQTTKKTTTQCGVQNRG